MRAYIIITLAFLILLPFANAQIVLPEFKEVYSIGDSIDSSFEIISSQDLIGQAKLELNCGEKTLFYTSPVVLKANEEKEIAVTPYILNKKGNCYIEAALEGQESDFRESAKSDNFIVSDYINISIKLNKESFKPGDSLRIKGEAKKANGNYIDSVASITLGSEGYSSIIKKGGFEFETVIKNSFSSGENEIIIEAEDSSGNSGSISKTINIAAIPSSLEIILNKDSFVPGDKLKTSAVLYDQSGKEIVTETSIILYNSWGMTVLKEMVNGSEEVEYEFDQKSPTGEWWVYAYAEGIRARRFIAIAEESKIDANINENLLEIINVGNTDFKKPIEVLFQNESANITEMGELNLGLEGQKKYQLTAPDGRYDIIVKAEDFEKKFSNVYLTGGVIGITDPENRTARIIQNIIALLIIAAIAAVAIILKLKRMKNQPISIGKSFNPTTKKFKEKL